MTTAAIVPASTVEELEFHALSWPERARACAVTDAAGFASAGELLTGIKTLRAEIASACDPVIAAAHKAHQAACHQKRALEAPLVEAEGILKRAIAAFAETEERRRREEEARLRERARQADEDARLSEAAALEAAGEADLARQVLDMPVMPAAVSLPKPTVAGITTRVVWRCEVTDLRALCRAVADGTVPVEAVTANAAFLGQMARALKESFAYPGCRVVSERTVAAKSR